MKNRSKYTLWQKINIILIIIVSILFFIFIAQNWDNVELTFLAWKVQISLFIALFVSFITGILITLVYFRIHIKALKNVIHKRNAEIDDFKKKTTVVKIESKS